MCIEPNGDGTYTLKCPNGFKGIGTYEQCQHIMGLLIGTCQKKLREKENCSVLDKIRAEVEAIERYGTNNGKDLWLRIPEEIKEDVLNIIDKYKKLEERRKP